MPGSWVGCALVCVSVGSARAEGFVLVSLGLSTWDACSLHLMGLPFLSLQPACGTGRVLGWVKLGL